MPSATCGAIAPSPRWRSARWPSASARTRLSLRSSNRCCCGPCPTTNRPGCIRSGRCQRSQLRSASGPCRIPNSSPAGPPRRHSSNWQPTTGGTGTARELAIPWPSTASRSQPISSPPSAFSRKPAGDSSSGIGSSIERRLLARAFSGRPRCAGQIDRSDGEPHMIVGVMPAGFDPAVELWVPAVLEPNNHHIAFRQVIGRLAAGATVTRAEAELDAANARVEAEESDRHGETEMAIAPLRDSVVGNARPALLVFLGAVGCVLLIACVNVANLLLSRASARKQEIAIRVSLGATRWRLARQLLTESAVLGVIGGLLGLIVALWGVETLIQLAPANRIPRIDEIRFDGWVFAFNIGISLLTSMLFGLAPALQLTRARGSARTGALRSLLVMAEVALALILLIGAGLLVRSFEKLRAVNLGFRPDNVLAMSMQLNGTPYEAAAQIQRFDNEILERISRVNGVTAAGLVN